MRIYRDAIVIVLSWWIATWASFAHSAITNRYAMQETSGTTLTDIVGSNTATISADTVSSTTGPGGELTAAVSFDGSHTFAFGTQINLGKDADWSLFLRFKNTTAGTGSWIGRTSVTTDYAINDSTTNIKCRFNGFIANYTCSAIDTGWHSVLIVHASGDDSHSVYLDGVVTTPTGSTVTDTPLLLDTIGDGSSLVASQIGALCDVRVYNSDESANAATIHADLTTGAVHTPTTYYVDSEAAGGGDGSEGTPYNDLQDGINALVATDTLLAKSTEAVPFRGSHTVTASNVTISAWGTGNNIYITDGVTSDSWSDAGGGVFSLVLAAEPTQVVYDWKQDDIYGTATGVDLTASKKSFWIARFGRTLAECCPYFGFLEDGGATSTPTDNQYGYTGGSLYVNPPGSPDLATVESLTQYVPGGANLLKMDGCDGTTVKDVIGLLSPDRSTGNDGYTVDGDGATNCTIEDCISYAAGYHAFGFRGSGSGAGNRMTNCLSVGMTGDDSAYCYPYVFYQDAAPLDAADQVGSKCVAILVPQFNTSGVPCNITGGYNATKFVPAPFLSHSAGGETTYSGITWSQCLAIDFLVEIETAKSMTFSGNAATGGWSAVSHGNGAATDQTDSATYPVTANDCVFVGVMVPGAANVYYHRCILDRGGLATKGTPAWSDPALDPAQIWETCVIREGLNSTALIRPVDSGTYLELHDCDIECSNTTANLGLIGVTSEATDPAKIFLNGNRWYAGSGNDSSPITASNSTVWTNGFVGVNSDGANVFDSSLGLASYSTNDPQDLTWWQATITGGSTDTTSASMRMLPITIPTGFQFVVGIDSLPHSVFNSVVK